MLVTVRETWLVVIVYNVCNCTKDVIEVDIHMCSAPYGYF